jgi:integrase
MASLIKDKKRYIIQLSPSENIKRPKISLGVCLKRDALVFKQNVEALIQSRRTGAALSAAATDWVNGLPSAMRQRLVSFDLLEAKPDDVLLLDWAQEFVEEKRRSPKIAKATYLKYLATYRKMQIFFKNESLSDVSPMLAGRFEAYLKEVIGLGDNTIAKHICQIKEMFAEAIRQDIIIKNPFDRMKTSVSANPERFFYITPELAFDVLNAMPSTEWKLLFALARFGGLRIPSEIQDLKWSDIHFDKDLFTVRSPKTAHFDNRGIRQVPIFPELKSLLLQAFEQAPEGEVYVLPKFRTENPRTQFGRYLEKAGIPIWQKPFQNCRSTRETELFKLTGGNIKAVCTWIGNTETVALKHYAQITDADVRQAAQIRVMSEGLAKIENKGEYFTKEKVHNTVHNLAKTSCEVLQVAGGKGDLSSLNCKSLQQKNATLQKDAKWRKMGDTGLEPVTPCL